MSAKGGSKKTLNLLLQIFKKLSVLLLIILVWFEMESLLKFFFKTFKAILSFSTKVTFAPLEMHSNPNDPTPQYKSKILDCSISILI